jgi:hypothetical protein
MHAMLHSVFWMVSGFILSGYLPPVFLWLLRLAIWPVQSPSGICASALLMSKYLFFSNFEFSVLNSFFSGHE